MTEQIVGLVINNLGTILTFLGVTGTQVSAASSVISAIAPDRIEKETKLFGLRVGALRGIYNPAMSIINFCAINKGKAANDPNKN